MPIRRSVDFENGSLPVISAALRYVYRGTAVRLSEEPSTRN